MEPLREAAGKLRQRDVVGLGQAEAAQESYGRDFDHPGWSDVVE